MRRVGPHAPGRRAYGAPGPDSARAVRRSEVLDVTGFSARSRTCRGRFLRSSPSRGAMDTRRRSGSAQPSAQSSRADAKAS
ncbi:hypothetical protein SLNWT_0478 [Streptomyces albus]|uniref:Uncharacterized protein n=1 Tax=Streptomyces albus (strain ATCC 21838 / DSM 41398 / FERM P-419 / JCM 4703 / NBRC 107858) TaxID=1081613 RepID=A0A0B5EHK4_STRA4|nr:hypothetical protein SLNWT_0478 [Streptomyces albus]AOU75166.1 hypothetical protein SLNHY_0475 [Streptomyces albus]AYN30972.1 hypothetical protein DUI70_0469 [Streptomyces albus]